MDFCEGCGILLPETAKDRGRGGETNSHSEPNIRPLCNPCQRAATVGPCTCEFCSSRNIVSETRKGTSLASTTEQESYSTYSIIDRPQSSSSSNSGKKRKESKDRNNRRTVSSENSATQKRAKKALRLFDVDVDLTEDNKSKFSEKENTEEKRESSMEPCHMNVLEDKMERAALETRPPKEYQVEEGIREKWEKEQASLKRKMVYSDSTTIAALVGGRRRKADGRRFFAGGVDISFIKGNKEDACACLTVVQLPDLQVVYQRMEMVKLTHPYIPGFLAFREVPSLMQLYHRLQEVAPQYSPDVILVDGNGILHPRGFGLASQLGVLLDVPTLGVAKSLISAQGIEENEEHKQRKRQLNGAGDGFDLVSDSGQVLGKCVQVHDKAPNPVYVSRGHKISLESAVWITLECSKFRIPEPIRRADLDSREYIRQDKTEPEEFIRDEDDEE